MNRREWKFVLILAGVLGASAWGVDWVPDEQPRGAAAESQPSTKPGETIAWEKSLDRALERSRKEKKPVMIEFYKTWQQWCKVLEDKTFAHSDVVQLSRKFVCARVDGEKSKELVKKYGIKSYPTVIYLNPKGELIHRVIGFVPPEPFKAEMLQIAKGREPEKEFQKLVRSHPKEFRPLVLLGVGYQKRQSWDKAIEAYERALRVSPGMEEKETQEVIYSLSLLYDYRKKPEKAERLLLRLLRTDSADKIKVHDMLGNIYLSMKQPDQAIEHFQAERNLVEDAKQRQALGRLIDYIRKRTKK